MPLPPRLSLAGNLAEDWKQWKQIYDAYETVTNLKSKPANFRVAAFITCIGPEALRIHNSLPYQEEGERQNIERIFELLNTYCIGETNVIYERYKFNNCTQGPTESIETYAASLRALAATCAFGPLNDELMRDRIVCGKSVFKLTQVLPAMSFQNTSFLQAQKLKNRITLCACTAKPYCR